MNIDIICDEITNELKTKLKILLINKFPNETNKIVNYINNLNIYDDVYITNDFISFDKMKSNIIYLTLTCEEYIKYNNLLNEIDKNAFAIKIKKDKEYTFISNYFKNNNYIIDDEDYDRNVVNEITILIVNNVMYAMFDGIYKDFFNNIKIIDASSFIRMIKLNKLNKYEI